MKRPTLALITAGMILGGAGVVEILGTETAASAPPRDRLPHTDQVSPTPPSSLADLFENTYPAATWSNPGGDGADTAEPDARAQ
ncbi:hypothetical protein [Nocardia donostiensis]|uniref:Uncharacterized protein n=1 Tax=Nocardia donostiensis TaxID=1538463 RepID=A0A1V2TIK6_9NOCA|nr:hypothetical protein [Nocardia donostiensis]ONM49369.1 hypothetical protein B0T46_08415 [Nocardia donostiensis]OQS14889.1 hypothetical protein B0T36_12675 [Nocardia donostiensis]OQS17594.1 hypothetical protein B0T44_23975 [Nocardia donostiensis]